VNQMSTKRKHCQCSATVGQRKVRKERTECEEGEVVAADSLQIRETVHRVTAVR
jgi:hypothetical protein